MARTMIYGHMFEGDSSCLCGVELDGADDELEDVDDLFDGEENGFIDLDDEDDLF